MREGEGQVIGPHKVAKGRVDTVQELVRDNRSGPEPPQNGEHRGRYVGQLRRRKGSRGFTTTA
jgi:hypothetical protein